MHCGFCDVLCFITDMCEHVLFVRLGICWVSQKFYCNKKLVLKVYWFFFMGLPLIVLQTIEVIMTRYSFFSFISLILLQVYVPGVMACSSHVEKGDVVAVSVAVEQPTLDGGWGLGITRGTVLQGSQTGKKDIYSSKLIQCL